MIADRGNKIIKNYNVMLTKRHVEHDKYQVDHAIPSKFIISKDRKLVWQYIGTKKDRPSIEQILEAIERSL